MSGHVHRVRVRYGECDMQGVVFNAHYLAYADDAVDTWFREAIPGGLYSSISADAGFDMMVRGANVVWTSPLRFGDTVQLTSAATRWGNTSFDVTITGTVDSDLRFAVTLTYVSVESGTHRPCRVPDAVRDALSDA